MPRGVKVAWMPSDEGLIALQITNSPFSLYPREDNLYAYNLAWSDSWNWYSSIWSVNMFEYQPGKYVKCIALGNMFYIGNFSLGLDCIALDTNLKDKVDDQLTINFMPSYEFEKVRIFGKLGWEQCTGELPYDLWGEYLTTEDMIATNDETLTTLPAFLIPGEDYWYYGAGVEYYPVESVRLHAVWASNNYTSHHTINIGATWRFNITNAIKRIACKR